ncbi:MAG: sulfurtransferase TusA family protein [Proteobacteria bacterium]|nr:sulfurtransferase TusA family protein [Pseudomonadota bacterium]
MTIDYHIFIDAKGLTCPQPLLLVKQASMQINAGKVLLLEATDSHTGLDLEVWCQRFGHAIIKTQQDHDIYRFWLRIHPTH